MDCLNQKGSQGFGLVLPEARDQVYYLHFLYLSLDFFLCFLWNLSVSVSLLIQRAFKLFNLYLQPDGFIDVKVDNLYNVCVRERNKLTAWKFVQEISEILTMAGNSSNGDHQTPTKSPPLPSPLRFSKFFQVELSHLLN